MMGHQVKVAGWLAGALAGLAMAAGGTLARPAAFLLGLLPRRNGDYFLGGELGPMHSRVFAIYLGLALAAACGFALAARLGRFRPGRFLFAILVILALLALSLSVNRAFWDDEIEHIHASWYVRNGQVPYRDFFEHHHPLLWILLAPVLSLCGEGLAVLGALRLLMLLLAFGIGWLTWRISRLAGGDAETAWLAVAILFSSFMFIPCVIEVRPDIPMVFLALAAVERLLVFMVTGKPKPLLAAAFSATLSFLFLQKVLFLFPAALVLLLAWRFTGKVRAALFWKTAAVFFLPLFLFAAWLFFSGAMKDYFLCNWLLNVKRQGAFHLWLSIGLTALINIVFWLSLLPAFFRALRPGKSSAAMKTVAWFGLTALTALVLMPNPADRHFLLVLPLLAVVVGAWAGKRSEFPLRGTWRHVYLAGLLIVPLPFIAALSFPFNGVQLEKFAYVLQRTAPVDKVFDGRTDFNLFRPDLHYFWFQTAAGEMLDNYRRLHRGRHSAYDVCRLIREQKPLFISFNGSAWTACNLRQKYRPTRFRHLFFRDPRPGDSGRDPKNTSAVSEADP
jgi:hypothetical protein